MNNPDVEKFMIAVGALAETCGALMTAFMKSGFTREESLYLVGESVKAFFNDKKNGN